MTSPVLVTSAEVFHHYGIRPKVVALSASSSTTLTILRDARVTGQPIAVTGADGALLWAFCPQLNDDPESPYVLSRYRPPPRPLAGRTLFAGADGFSYYHWLTGVLPRLIAGTHAQEDDYDHYLVNARHKGQENFQTETLRLLQVPITRAVWLERGTHFQCENLTLPAEPCMQKQTEMQEWARQLLRSTFLPMIISNTNELPRRIYIARSQARRRRLVDETALIERLAADGFAAITLEDMPFLDQVRLFAGADIVVGLHGAGLSNLVFASPGTKVLEFLPEAWPHPCFSQLAKRSNLDYAALTVSPVGERQGFQADATVDVTIVAKQLSSWLKG